MVAVEILLVLVMTGRHALEKVTKAVALKDIEPRSKKFIR